MASNTLYSTAAPSRVAAPDAPVPDTELLRALQARGTMRNFKPDALPEAWIDTLISAAQRAPTSSNLQAYSIIVVKDLQTKTRLAELAGNQKHIIDCPVFFAFCADLTRIEYACELHDTAFPGHTFESGLVSSMDAALVGMTMSLVADSMGLGNVMIGGMRNKPLEVAKLLKLPKRVYVVYGLCVGWPKALPLPKPRQPMSTVVHRESYNPAHLAEGIAAYDKELAAYYVQRGANTPPQAWTTPVAEKYSTPRRRFLRQELNELGFGFE
jgi:FMN reductase (NADPH)